MTKQSTSREPLATSAIGGVAERKQAQTSTFLDSHALFTPPFCNQGVAGSIPAAGTKYCPPNAMTGFLISASTREGKAWTLLGRLAFDDCLQRAA